MKNSTDLRVKAAKLFLLALVCLAAMQVQAAAAVPLRFSVELAPELSDQAVSGRLLIFMTRSSEPMEVVQPSFFEFDKVWIAAMDISNFTPGKALEFNPDALAYPAAFSTASAGDYQFMALLDIDHSYPYSGMGPGDLRSVVVVARDLKPADTQPIRLILSKRIEDEHLADTDSVKRITFESPLLSAFWGRPIAMHAAVVLPPGYSTSPKKRFPVVYKIHGFGGNHLRAWREAPALTKKMTDGTTPEMIYVYLDGYCPMGHHEFADSVNNGPWGQALTKEFFRIWRVSFAWMQSRAGGC